MDARDTAGQHPWLRVSLLLRAILNHRWDGEAWRQIRREIPKALALRDRVRQAGFFN